MLFSQSPELIRNGGFEQIVDSGPAGACGPNKVRYWYDPNQSSSDYFNLAYPSICLQGDDMDRVSVRAGVRIKNDELIK